MGSCLVVADVVGPNSNVFMILLCSIFVSRRIAYSYAYASCGGLVSAKNSTAILLLFICGVIISLTLSSSLFPPSVRDTNLTKSAWNCSSDSLLLFSTNEIVSFECKYTRGKENNF